jgi:prophage maintenance system killer protein
MLLLLLQLNGCEFSFQQEDDQPDQDAVATALAVASGQIDEEGFIEWLRTRLREVGIEEEILTSEPDDEQIFPE